MISQRARYRHPGRGTAGQLRGTERLEGHSTAGGMDRPRRTTQIRTSRNDLSHELLVPQLVPIFMIGGEAEDSTVPVLHQNRGWNFGPA